MNNDTVKSELKRRMESLNSRLLHAEALMCDGKFASMACELDKIRSETERAQWDAALLMKGELKPESVKLPFFE
jgi:hypothetical protein